MDLSVYSGHCERTIIQRDNETASWQSRLEIVLPEPNSCELTSASEMKRERRIHRAHKTNLSASRLSEAEQIQRVQRNQSLAIGIKFSDPIN